MQDMKHLGWVTWESLHETDQRIPKIFLAHLQRGHLGKFGCRWQVTRSIQVK